MAKNLLEMSGQDKKMFKLQQLKNRTQMQINRIEQAQKKIINNQRKAETRTKIQLGGLILKSGLGDICNIEAGDDLQLDFNKRDHAALLLGLLVHAKRAVEEKPDLLDSCVRLGRIALQLDTKKL